MKRERIILADVYLWQDRPSKAEALLDQYDTLFKEYDPDETESERETIQEQKQ